MPDKQIEDIKDNTLERAIIKEALRIYEATTRRAANTATNEEIKQIHKRTLASIEQVTRRFI